MGCRSDCRCLCPVMAAEDVVSAFFEWIELDGFLTEIFDVIRHERADSTADNDVAVVAHAQIIDGNCQIIQIVVKDSAVSRIAGG